MVDSLTLAQLRTTVRQRADMVNSQFCSDSEINGYINYSYKELYDLITEAAEEYNVTQYAFTVASGSNSASLPTDFYKLRGIDDLQIPAYPRTVRKFAWNERNDYANDALLLSIYDYSNVTYRLNDLNVIFEPPLNAPKNYLMWYVPQPGTLSSDSDIAYGVQGWLEYVTIDAAIKCLIKEESDISPLMAQKSEMKERITRMRANRDQAMPEKISRVRNRRRNGIYPFSMDYTP